LGGRDDGREWANMGKRKRESRGFRGLTDSAPRREQLGVRSGGDAQSRGPFRKNTETKKGGAEPGEAFRDRAVLEDGRF